VTEIVRRDELQAAIEARAELGADTEPAVIAGVSMVCGALAVIAYVSTR
jgi:hypothetical protein